MAPAPPPRHAIPRTWTGGGTGFSNVMRGGCTLGVFVGVVATGVLSSEQLENNVPSTTHAVIHATFNVSKK